MELKEATTDQLIEELIDKCRWIAVAYCSEADDVGVICHGDNGFEILGGISLLQDSHLKAVRSKTFID